jgi:hypothetical protein
VKLFNPRNASAPATDSARALEEISARLDKLERVVTDLKQNIDLLPAIVRKLYLADVELPPPYDLLTQRFGYISQNEEDGLLLALFKRLGTTDRRFIEIGCGMNGGNCGFLARECGWSGLMIDAKSAAIEKIRVKYAGHAVTAVKQRVSREGVNVLLQQFGFTGEIDLLSVDIDGMDYWVWEAITACNPRVVVVEYNWLFGADRPITIPYAPTFDVNTVGTRAYRGASLAAMAHLGRQKGYRLVVTERVNAFFLRRDVAPDVPEIGVSQGYRAPVNIASAMNVFEKLRRKVKRDGLPFVNVVTGQPEEAVFTIPADAAET